MGKPGIAISLPPRVLAGQPITAKHFNAIRESLSRLARSGGGDKPSLVPRKIRQALFPFLTKEGDGYFVSVTPGYVTERLVISSGECIVYHLPDFLYEKDGEGANTTTLAKLAIAEGQCVAVKVNTLQQGMIGLEPEDPPPDPPPMPVTLEVVAADIESLHYEPPIGDSEGAVGYYYYKLGTLTDGKLDFGSNIPGHDLEHWAELATFKVKSGANPWKEWNGEEGIYYTKGFIAAGQLTLAENEDDLTYQGNKRNLEVRFRESGASEPEGEETLNFEDGLSMDGEVDATPATERDIILPIVSGISPIIVNRVGEGERNFQISLEEGGDGDNFNIKLLNVSITESGGETFVSDIGWGSADRFFYVRNGKLFLTDDAAVVDTYEVISRIQGEDFAVNPTNQSGDGLTPAS